MTALSRFWRFFKAHKKVSLGSVLAVLGLVVAVAALGLQWLERFDPIDTGKPTPVSVMAETTVPAAVTELSAAPDPVVGPHNLVPGLNVTVKRSNQPLTGAVLKVGGDTCSTNVTAKAGESPVIVCKVPADVAAAAVVEATELTVTLTEPDAPDTTATVTVDLSPNRCLPAQPASTAPLEKSNLIGRWNAAEAAPPTLPCRAGSADWTLEPTTWTATDNGSEQFIGASSIEFEFVAAGESAVLDRMTITVAQHDLDDVDHVNALVGAVFSKDADEMDSLLDRGMDRACSAEVAYSINQRQTDLDGDGEGEVTTLSVVACGTAGA